MIRVLNAYEKIENGKGFKSIKAERKWIKDKFHAIDDSRLWPIRNKFNATHRAICRVARIEKANGEMNGIELIYAIDNEISNIVNDSSNF